MEYKRMGYWEPDYEPKDTDVIALFRVTPQDGVDPIEAARGGRRRILDRDLDRGVDRPADRGGEISRQVLSRRSGAELAGQYFAYIAYDLDLFEPGSIANLSASIIGNVFGFKPLKALRLEDMRLPVAYVKTFQGPATGIVVERERLDKFGRPLLGATVKPKLGLSGRNYGRVVYEALKGGLDFTKDDENINSQPFMHWRDRFLYCMEAVNRGAGGDRRGQGHLSQRHRRHDGGHVRARRVRPGARLRHRHDRPRDRLHRDPVDGEMGAPQRHDPASAPRRPLHLHAAEDPRRLVPRHRQMDAPRRRRPHPRRHGGRQARRRPEHHARLLRHLREDFNPMKLEHGVFFDQHWASLNKLMPVASGGIHAGQMHQLLDLLGEDVVLQFGGGTIGHPRASRPARRPTAWRWKP